MFVDGKIAAFSTDDSHFIRLTHCRSHSLSTAWLLTANSTEQRTISMKVVIELTEAKRLYTSLDSNLPISVVFCEQNVLGSD
jgi:hypothetical protein